MLATKNSSSHPWLLLAVVNLFIVGILGLLMRLKMIMPLTWLNQKFLLHAHSHFAFSGWVSHALMVLVLTMFCLGYRNSGGLRFNKTQQWLVLGNLITAYGMLITFIFQGYAFYSIAAASLSVLISYIFSAYVWRNGLKSQQDEGEMSRIGRSWIRASLVLLVLSSFGTFALSYLMANHNMDARKQLAAVYFYLHFQYNGWFLFACLGLFHHWLGRQGIQLKRSALLFRVFAVAVIPTYFLSVLWWKDMPGWLYALVVLVTIAQLLAWVIWVVEVLSKAAQFKSFASLMVRILLLLVGLAYSVKVLLQALSLIPDLSQLAYGYRPIVIGYLHLILLVVISLFILSYIFAHHYLHENRIVRAGVYTAVTGILLNEVILMVQGLSGMLRIYVDHTHQLLVVASTIICLGLLVALLGQTKKSSGG